MTKRRTAMPSSLHAIAALLLCAACTPLQRKAPRLAQASYDCMHAAVVRYVPREANDTLQHCLAAGFIARRCSVAEARLASWGKEFTDIFDGGDPSAADLRADRTGIACARRADTDANLIECCEASAQPRAALVIRADATPE